MADFQQHKDDKLDYAIDYSEWLDDNETIDNSTWSIEPSGELEVASTPAPAYTDKKTNLWLQNGDTHKVYEVTNQIETSKGNIHNEEFTIRIVE